MTDQSKDFRLLQDQEMTFEIVSDEASDDIGLMTSNGFVSLEQLTQELRSLEGFELHLKVT